jgi:hypothetical protein
LFVGHLGVALAAKRATPATSLGWLVAAVTLADLLWPIFMLAGIETARVERGATPVTPLVFESYPWSHSLLMMLGWGLVLGALARWRGVDTRGMWWIVALVVSHWVLDVVTHVPDMPLWPGPSPRFGFSLWNSIPASFAVEGALWIACITIYLRAQKARSWVGHLAFWSFVLINTAMWASGPWGTPPATQRALALFALIGWIVIPWALWIERTHSARPA